MLNHKLIILLISIKNKMSKIMKQFLYIHLMNNKKDEKLKDNKN